MCNLYHMSPKDDFEIYVRRHLGKVWLPEAPLRPVVGPFGEGQFVRRDGDGGLVGVNGQWGLIRVGAVERISYVQPKAQPGKKPPSSYGQLLDGQTVAPKWHECRSRSRAALAIIRGI